MIEAGRESRRDDARHLLAATAIAPFHGVQPPMPRFWQVQARSGKSRNIAGAKVDRVSICSLRLCDRRFRAAQAIHADGARGRATGGSVPATSAPGERHRDGGERKPRAGGPAHRSDHLRSPTIGDAFSAECGKSDSGGLVPVVGGTYVAPRRGTESQRARPPRCEALPPKPTDLRVGQPTFGTTGAGSSSGAGPRHFRATSSRLQSRV
jgi:hypothetical protein